VTSQIRATQTYQIEVNATKHRLEQKQARVQELQACIDAEHEQIAVLQSSLDAQLAVRVAQKRG
jgi:hypothetical protein